MTDAPKTDGQTAEPTATDKRDAVRDRYGDIAADGSASKTADEAHESTESTGCCGDSSDDSSSCCGADTATSDSETLGYDPQRSAAVPKDANLGLGCGNPTAIAELQPGETVLDLGSGGGFDCFLAAEEVGPAGQVIGVDMTPEMVTRARRNADRSSITNVDFRLGEIEHLPVADESVDVIMSNCVINLSPAKAQVFEEASRVLKPGGRLAITDIALTERGLRELDEDDLDQYAACISGAATLDKLKAIVERAGFELVSVRPEDESESIIEAMYDDDQLQDRLYSARITGRKPD